MRIESELLYEEIDAHGHDIDPDRIECASCREALETDGFCNRCSIGFVKKQAYMSRLTYSIAKGTTKDAAAIECAACRKNAQQHGWCDSCKIGMVGNVALTDRNDFERAAQAYEVLGEAIRTLKRCVTCAVAMVTDGYCAACKITYTEGKKVEPKKPGP